MTMDTNPISQAIRDAHFATQLADSTVARLAQLSQLKKWPRGAVLFREGELHEGFYIVRQGHIALEMAQVGRGETRVLTVGPGEVLAWSSLVGDGRMTATAVAQDDVELIAMSGRELAAACEADHELGFHVMRRLAAALSRRLFATRLQLLDLFAADRQGASA